MQWSNFRAFPDRADRYAPDGAYAFIRLGLSLLIATLIGVGMWGVIVVLPPAQLDFGVDRSQASLPYTVMMCALAFSTIALGRVTDRYGIVPPLIMSAIALGLGFVLAGYAPNLVLFTAAHALIGIGAGTGFAPMMADISHWFVRRRGLAVVIVAAGNYFAGTIWPLLMSARHAVDRLAGDLRGHWRHSRGDSIAARSRDAPTAGCGGLRAS